MRTVILMLVLCLGAAPARADKVTPTGPVKAYKGPEGQIVAMLEISDGKEMLVHFRNLDTTLDGKTLRYQIEDQGHGDKNVYIVKKRGSKTYQSMMLVLRDHAWTFFHPTKADVHFDLAYSEDQSAKMSVTPRP
jgi:hypothetical protein